MMGALDALNAVLTEHADCAWKQTGPCVWCTDHGLRLYQGELPEHKRTIPRCAEHDWDPEMGQGFYLQCPVCGEMEWLE